MRQQDMRRDQIPEVLEMDGLVPECVAVGMRGYACGAGEKETAGGAEGIHKAIISRRDRRMEMNKARLSYGRDTAVTIEISDEACRRFFE